jgi:mono/diheme cytochrome c family protein
MSLFVTKTILAAIFIAAGITAALSMLTLMGRSEKRMGAAALRTLHRVTGYTFAVLLAALAILGLRYLSSAGDSLPVRGVLHWSLAALLVFLVALKLAVVRWFKQFLKFVPVMGMVVIMLALVVATLSAVFFVVSGGARLSGVDSLPVEVAARPEPDAADEPREDPPEPATTDDSREGPAAVGRAPDEPAASAEAPEDAPAASAELGREVYAANCAGCHYHDSTDNRIGPGLAGYFSRDRIGSSGKPVTVENVREQIVSPAGGMPAFEDRLTAEELDDLMAYLKTL